MHAFERVLGSRHIALQGIDGGRERGLAAGRLPGAQLVDAHKQVRQSALDPGERAEARIGGVESVEVMGDFSDWTPLPLMRRGRDHWELLVPMKAGVHQINMRIDGGQWIAPPGMPTMKDDFSGDVGVVVVKPEK